MLQWMVTHPVHIDNNNQTWGIINYQKLNKKKT